MQFSSKAWHAWSAICHRVHCVLASERWECLHWSSCSWLLIECSSFCYARTQLLWLCWQTPGYLQVKMQVLVVRISACVQFYFVSFFFFFQPFTTKVHLDKPCLNFFAAILLSTILVMWIAFVSPNSCSYTVTLANVLTKAYVHFYETVAPCCVIGHFRLNRVFCMHTPNGRCTTTR